MLMRYGADCAAQNTSNSRKKSTSKTSLHFHTPSNRNLSAMMSGATSAPERISDIPEGLKKKYNLRTRRRFAGSSDESDFVLESPTPKPRATQDNRQASAGRCSLAAYDK